MDAHITLPVLRLTSVCSVIVAGGYVVDVLEGNAHTDMAAGHTQGALQPDGRVVPEPTFDLKHVADSIVHIASLPNDVTVLEFNIM